MLLKAKMKFMPISTIYFLIGGTWVAITIFFFLEGIQLGEEQRGEWLLCYSGLLLTASLLFFLIRQLESSLEESQDALVRAKRALRVRSEFSQVMVRASGEQEMMDRICRIIVESEGYCLAWVGIAEDDPAKTIRPVAHWGLEKGYLDDLRVSWGDDEHGRGPTGVAVRSGIPSVVQHIHTDPKWEPWRERALLYGYASSISLPLRDEKRIFGALVIFAGEPDAFDTQEFQLLKGLAEDLSYGITTLRERLEQQRGKKELILLGTILEQEADGVLTFDMEGKVLYVNPAFEIITGFGREAAVGSKIIDLAADDHKFYRIMADAFKQGQARTDRFINHRSDGGQNDLEIRTTPICGASGVIAYASIIRDRTHEVMLERQLRQAQKMEAIATLAGGIAHDFNNILAAIISNAEMAMDQAVEDESLQENLAIILKAGLRAKNLVKQIRALSFQGKSERLPLHMETIVKECLKLLRATLPTTIAIPYHPTVGSDLVLADPTQIHQVVMNLCTNAGDAMREKGGVLDISLATVDLPIEDPLGSLRLPSGRYLRLTVADTGLGMDRKTMERIFDPFFTTKGPDRGTGLGLSVAHGIIKNHGGEITFTSELGRGTTFNVYLPRLEQRDEKAEKTGAETISQGKGRILFLDDEEDLVSTFQKMLEKLGYEVVAGTDSQEALEVFRAQPDRFDLVITDQTMPHLTGDKLARELLKIRPDIPIILCTGFGQISSGVISEKAALDIGIRAVVMKPVERSEIARIIRRVLS